MPSKREPDQQAAERAQARERRGEAADLRVLAAQLHGLHDRLTNPVNVEDRTTLRRAATEIRVYDGSHTEAEQAPERERPIMREASGKVPTYEPFPEGPPENWPTEYVSLADYEALAEHSTGEPSIGENLVCACGAEPELQWVCENCGNRESAEQQGEQGQ